ncbi:hypothetical protein SGLAM104S_07928 [Streptomyces glaucescens]
MRLRRVGASDHERLAPARRRSPLRRLGGRGAGSGADKHGEPAPARRRNPYGALADNASTNAGVTSSTCQGRAP